MAGCCLQCSTVSVFEIILNIFPHLNEINFFVEACKHTLCASVITVSFVMEEYSARCVQLSVWAVLRLPLCQPQGRAFCFCVGWSDHYLFIKMRLKFEIVVKKTSMCIFSLCVWRPRKQSHSNKVVARSINFSFKKYDILISNSALFLVPQQGASLSKKIQERATITRSYLIEQSNYPELRRRSAVRHNGVARWRLPMLFNFPVRLDRNVPVLHIT